MIKFNLLKNIKIKTDIEVITEFVNNYSVNKYNGYLWRTTIFCLNIISCVDYDTNRSKKKVIDKIINSKKHYNFIIENKERFK